MEEITTCEKSFYTPSARIGKIILPNTNMETGPVNRLSGKVANSSRAA